MPVIVDSYSESNSNGFDALRNTSYFYIGQSFLNDSLTQIQKTVFYLRKQGSPTGSIYSQLYAHIGNFGGNSGLATGLPLATSDAVDVSTLTGSATLTDFIFSGTQQINMLSETHYVNVLKYLNGTVSNYLQVGERGLTPSHAGTCCTSVDGLTWATRSGIDLCFYVYGLQPKYYSKKYPRADLTFQSNGQVATKTRWIQRFE